MGRSQPSRKPRAAVGVRLAVALLFAASGVAALVDQVVWTRWMALSLGASSYAAVVVLATFMAGLGLGSGIAGWIGDRRPERDLAFFAAAEAVVGLWSLLSIPLVGQMLPGWAARLAGPGGLPAGARGLLAAACLLIPTLAMGATLPLLARWAVQAGGLPGSDVGRLYTLNTLGAAAGALLAAFVLIDALGLSGSVALAGGIDLAVAAGALLLARRARRQSLSPAPAPPVALHPLPRGAFALTAAAFCVSGLAGLGLEVVAHRILAVLAGSSAYAFATMLAAFLVGIALGSLAAGRLADRTAFPGCWVAYSLGALTLGLGLARLSFDSGFYRSAGRGLARLVGLGAWAWGGELAGSFLALLPASLTLGFVVPMVARIAAARPEKMGRRFALAYALNTLGAVAGALAGGLWALPRLGSAGTLSCLAALTAAAGLAVAAAAVPAVRRRRTLVITAALCLGGALSARGTDPVRHGLLGRFAADQVLTFTEGPVQTLAVVEEDNPQQLRFRRLITNQTSLTGTHLYARRYMRLLGHLPVLYARTPRRALVICLGTGMTGAAVASHPQIERIDIAEISPGVVDALPLFEAVNGDLLSDPRTKLWVEDGRHLMLSRQRRWDLITLEPPPPRDSGVVALYTRDFYELGLERLSPGGVFAQWIPLHSQSDAEVAMLVQAFLGAFEHVLGFLPVERELLLLGSASPLKVDLATLDRRLAPAPVQASLGEIGLADGPSLLAAAWLDRRGLEAIAGDAAMVTDDRPRVEYFARHGRRPALPRVSDWIGAPPAAKSLLTAPPPPGWTRRLEAARTALGEMLRGAWATESGDRRQGEALRLRALARRPRDPYLQWVAGVSDEHLERLRRRTERRPKSVAAWRLYALRLGDRGRLDAAFEAYKTALELNPDDPETLLAFGNFLMGRGRRPDLGRRVLRRLLAVAPTHPAAPAIRRLLGGR
ncbi:MAG: fused MFS/spermidine synthase [Acidobacteriota bacterium]|nr:fused MFS/spermidine synthase [Acidobacteriota bacterium]